MLAKISSVLAIFSSVLVIISCVGENTIFGDNISSVLAKILSVVANFHL